ncbi:hypothetical protein QPK13_07665 [Photorhabdus tasmaniensis]
MYYFVVMTPSTLDTLSVRLIAVEYRQVTVANIQSALITDFVMAIGAHSYFQLMAL